MKATPTNRYRSVNFKFSPQSCVKSHHLSIQRTTANQLFTARHHHKVRQLSLLNNSSKKMRTENQQSAEEVNMAKSTYMNSFHFLLNLEKNKYNAKDKQAEKLRSSEKRESRVILPVLSELDSHFTLLDNVHIPINYIGQEINKAHNELGICSQEIQKIGQEIKSSQQQLLRGVEEIEVAGRKAVLKLRAMIKSNRVSQQETVLKLKSSLDRCEDYLPNFNNQLEDSKQRLINLQETIFPGQPFELKQLAEYQAISSHYF